MKKTNPNVCVLIIHKSKHTEAATLSSKIATWLFSKDYKPVVVSSATEHDYTKYEPEFVVILGGDGSVIEVARQFVANPVPLVCINFGKVGFLTSVSPRFWKESIQEYLDKKARISKRMALKWRIMNKDIVIYSGYAVNDVVINRGTLSRIVTFIIHADEYEICTLRADGLIISSPIGVTGYAVSAGGPLVYPSINALIITPICPFLCNFPALVLPCPMQVKASVVSQSSTTYVTIDGQRAIPLDLAETVHVEGFESRIHFVRNSNTSYFSRLKARGFIEEYSSPSMSYNEIKNDKN